MQRRTREIAPGQSYRKVAKGGGLWEVVSVRTDESGATHARLKSLSDPGTFRTFAIEAVLDMRNFLPIED
jgi:hypothetical protein